MGHLEWHVEYLSGLFERPVRAQGGNEMDAAGKAL